MKERLNRLLNQKGTLNMSFVRDIFRWRFLLGVVVVFVLAATAPIAWTEDDDEDDDAEIPFSEAEIFFELNNSDGDLGIHALIDGDAWRRLKIEDPNERRILGIGVSGRLRRQGLTQLFFESAEPPFDELSPATFFARFPEGTYEISARTLDGEEMESETQLTHVMPAPPAPTVNDLPVAEQCDDEEPGFDATETSAPVVISWPAVMFSHPDPDGPGAAVQPPVEVVIHNYEVVVEVTAEVNGEEFVSIMSVTLPPGETSVTIPDEFLAQGDEFKYEVLAREESFNQTAIESCFVLTE